MPAASAPQEESLAVSRYEMIRDTLRASINQGRAAPGLVLVEAPLAQLFGTSRVPVRQALNLLHDEGLICRFEGRGYLVNPHDTAVEPLRTPLTRQLLGLETEDELIDVRPLGERAYEDLAASVGTFMVFGHYRLDEQLAAEHLNVSRSVVREALMRLRDRGLVEKEPYSQWLAGPLTAQSVIDDYELRCLLEPQALKQSAPGLTHEVLHGMLERIELARQTGNSPERATIERIEHDLHVACLAGLRNQKMASLIRQCQSQMNIGRILHGALRRSLDEAMLDEHYQVIEALLANDIDRAANALRHHLSCARERTLQRLKVLSVLPEPALPSYLIRLS
ncbi:GntR family transcriptional regulator [Phytopseudomonas daroniae]|uniref:GntR family transcriptional regulator n=1 Tax=Phytopseudomonas daroniae TaxID=2487519 RepID=UPI0010385A3C|nr:GntR family transcriptional regulator [Pseudomonas daroniae]TBU75367.1 GntR family transcriptional regulator [Pseudomonas daroniae]